MAKANHFIVLKNFADTCRAGDLGADMDAEAAQTLALAIDAVTTPEPSLLGETISRMVAGKLDAAFVEKEVDTRVGKLVVEAVDHALRSFSDTGKLIEAAVSDALRVNKLDLPAYGHVVAAMLKAQIEARVSELVSGRLAQDMEELLSLAPKEVRLSDIAKAMLDEGHHGVEHGDAITVFVDRSKTSPGYAHIYLDDETVRPKRDKYLCRHQLDVTPDGVIYGAIVDNHDLKSTKRIGPVHGISQKLRAYVACGTKLILDEDSVVTGIGDY